jgi:hypothetical protein
MPTRTIYYRPDRRKIAEFAGILFKPFPQPYRLEIRTLHTRVDYKYRTVESCPEDWVTGAWVTHPMMFAGLVPDWFPTVTCYCSPNPVRRDTIEAKKLDRVIPLHKGMSTSLRQITHFYWLVIDIDPKRHYADEVLKKGMLNSTDAETKVCVDLAGQIVEETGIADHSIVGMSGNGAFIMIRVDLGNTSDAHRAMRRFVEKLDLEYSHEDAHVDVFNPARIMPIPGTWKYKADHETPDRPYRMVHFLSGPRSPSVFDIREWVACNVVDPAGAPPPQTDKKIARGFGGRAKLAPQWLAEQPPAEEGKGTGWAQTLVVINGLVTRFKLDHEQVLEYFLEHYNPRCKGPWCTPEDMRAINAMIDGAIRKRDEWEAGRQAAKESRGKMTDLDGWTMPDWTKDNPLFGGK